MLEAIRTSNNRLIEINNLKVQFILGGGLVASLLGGETRVVKAVDGVSFSITKGEILGLAGESGCGKTTTGMSLVRLYKPSEGEISFAGRNVALLEGNELKQFREKAQIVFQNPYESLNPRFSVFDIIAEMLIIHRIGTKAQRIDRVANALTQAGLTPPEDYFRRLPHELSGGERQRVAIARAMVLNPVFLVADEPIAMLDVSIRAGVLNLLKSLAEEETLSILYISHDLSSIKYICDRVMIMYLGVIVEMGETDDIVERPLHPYTQALVSAIPLPDPEAGRSRIESMIEVPSPIDLPRGCRYAPRCPMVMDVCFEVEPELKEVEPGRYVACYLYEE